MVTHGMTAMMDPFDVKACLARGNLRMNSHYSPRQQGEHEQNHQELAPHSYRISQIHRCAIYSYNEIGLPVIQNMRLFYRY